VNLPEPDPDQELLSAALRAAGVEAEMLAWDDPQATAAAFELCILRSPWNYYEDLPSFLEWVGRAEQETRLLNSGDVIRWNAHKGYLRELEAAGVGVVPTAWVPRGEPASLADVMEREAWEEVVVKPAVSAGSYRTQRFHRSECDPGQRFLDDLSRDGDAMIQEFMTSTEDHGERALVWIDGAFTHAVRKSPRFSGADEEVSDGMALTGQELAFGERVMSLVEGDLLYGRVDIMQDEDGAPRLSELELMEPSLFLCQSPAALNRYVNAIVKALGTPPGVAGPETA
jgi:hypothetical protein